MLSQPATKRSRKIWRILALTLAALFVLFIVFFLGSYLSLKSYLRSDSFRKLISRKTSEAFRADGEYMPLHWSGQTVYSDGYEARGSSEAVFSSLRAEQVRADLSASHRAWLIDNVEIQRLRLMLGSGTAVVHQPVKTAASPSFWLAWLPSKVELRNLVIQETDVMWAPTGSLRHVRAQIAPDGNTWLVEGTGGELRNSDWPVLGVEKFRLRLQGSEIFVTESRLHLGEKEIIEVNGKARSDNLDLFVRGRNINVSPFLPEDWRARLKAVVDAETQVRGAPDTVKVEGTLTLKSGQLEALPILDRIATFTQTAQFRQFSLQRGKAVFTWEKTKLVVRQFLLESEGLIRIEGEFVVEGRQLDGKFQVGVTANSLRWLPGAQKRVFTEERDGYVWTTVRVTGPLDRLQEDLSPRLLSAAGAAAVDTAADVVEKGVRGVVDLLKPLLP